jgi:hypothetical protein
MNTALLYNVILNSRSINQYVVNWISQGILDGGISPSPAVINALSTFVNSLESSGIGPSSSRMLTCNIMHAGSKEFVKLNIKNPATFKYTEVGTVTFSEGNGCRSASSSYFHHAFKSNQYAGIESNLTSINYVSESSTSLFNTISGFRTSSTDGAIAFYVQPLNSASAGLSRAYDANATTFSSNNHKGLYVLTRNGGNNIIYKDGSKRTIATAGIAPTNSCNRIILGYNGSSAATLVPLSQYTKYVAFDALYDAFSDADELAFRTAFNTYKTAVGLP